MTLATLRLFSLLLPPYIVNYNNVKRATSITKQVNFYSNRITMICNGMQKV